MLEFLNLHGLLAAGNKDEKYKTNANEPNLQYTC